MPRKLVRRAILIAGVVAGALLVVIGVLALAGGAIAGSLALILPGAALMAVCLALLIRPGESSAGASGFKAEAAYLGWFDRCAREQGVDDPIVLHAATMAALATLDRGNADAALAARRVAAEPPVSPVQTKIEPAKLRVLSRGAAGTLPLLEPGERVLVMVFGANRLKTSAWSAMLGVIGQLIAATGESACYVTVTDRRVIALNAAQLGGRVLSFAFAEPRATAAAAFPNQPLNRGAFRVTRLSGGGLSLQVGRAWRREARVAAELLSPQQAPARA